MGVRCRAMAAVCLACCVTVGCAAPLEGQSDGDEPPIEDEPLDVSIESLDILHHALRIHATMVDGAADLSVRLGGQCTHREVGGGLSTRSTLVWRLGEIDLADAIDCGIRIEALVRDDGRTWNKTAELAVTAELSPDSDVQELDDDGNAADVGTTSEGPAIVSTEVARCVLQRRPLVVSGSSFAVTLSVGGTSMGTESDATGEPDGL